MPISGCSPDSGSSASVPEYTEVEKVRFSLPSPPLRIISRDFAFFDSFEPLGCRLDRLKEVEILAARLRCGGLSDAFEDFLFLPGIVKSERGRLGGC